MGALGLAKGQFAIGANVYTNIREISLPEAKGQRIVHQASNVTTFPVKELGYLGAEVGGVAQLTAGTLAALAAFIADVRNGTAERKISWWFGDVEVYSYAWSGDVGAPTCYTAFGTVASKYRIPFTFQLSRSRVYKASDDSIQWGG